MFLLIGGTAALAYSVIAGVLVNTGLRPWVASSLAYACCVPFAYLGQKRITFKSDAKHGIALPRYIAAQLAGFVLAGALSEIVLSLGQVNSYFGYAIVAVTVASTNYLLLKLWAFATHD